MATNLPPETKRWYSNQVVEGLPLHQNLDNRIFIHIIWDINSAEEYPAFNRLVLGSNPRCPIDRRSSVIKYQLFGRISEWLKESDCKSDGSAFAGSNPAPPTLTL